MTMAVFADRVRREYMPTIGYAMGRFATRVLKFLAEGEGLRVRTTNDLDGDLIQRFVRFLNANLPRTSDHYRDQHIATLRVLYGLAHQWGCLASVPEFPRIPNWSETERVRPLPLDVIRRLLCHLRSEAGTFKGQRGYTLVCTMLFTGLTREATSDLGVDDVDLDSGTITIEGTARPIPPQLKPVLAPWVRRLRKVACRHLFPADNLSETWRGSGGRSGDSYANNWLRAAARAAGVEGVDYRAIRRAHLAYAVSIPVIPELEPAAPPKPLGNHRSGKRTRAPARELDLGEATQLMVSLAQGSASWKGHRLFAIAGLSLFQGLRREEILDIRREDVHLDRSPPRLIVAGRMPEDLTEEAAEILRSWLARPDQAQSKHVFPGVSLRGPWVADGDDSRKFGLRTQLRKAAAEVGIPGRIILGCLAQCHRRCKGRVQLGDAWRNISLPEPVLDGPRQPWDTTGKPKGAWTRKRRDASASLPDLATWDPPIPAVQIKGPDDPVIVNGKDKGTLSPAVYRAVKLLVDAWPGGLTRGEMTKRYEGEGWRQHLMKLVADPDWAAAIGFPGRRHGGLYRILPGRAGPSV
jgi:integrase